jgi:hypothetical protein
MIDLIELEPYLAGMVSDILAAGGVVGGVRIGGGLWIGAVDQAPDGGDLYLEGSIRRSAPVAARLHLAADWSLGDNAWTGVPWDTADLNLEGMWLVVTPGRITCQVDGLYLVILNVKFNTNSTGSRQVGVRMNGSTYLVSTKVFNPSATNTTPVAALVLISLTAGDYLEGMVYQNSGGGLNVVGSVETNIGIVRLA